MANSYGNAVGNKGAAKSNISGKGGTAKQVKSPLARSGKVAGMSPASAAGRKVSPSRGKSVSGAKALVTGGTKKWSGASNQAGGKGGKTFGGGKGVQAKMPANVPNALKPPKMTGHTAGAMPGNMMGHSTATKPFENTGMQPQGGKVGEVSVKNLVNSQGKNPGAKKLEGGSLGKLASSVPYGTPGSWTGGSGGIGGSASKTFGGKGKKGY